MIIRPEEEKDYFEVENLARSAFWNLYRPGCFAHYVIHKFRDDKDFVRDLDFVIEDNGKIVAQIIYANTKIKADDGREIPILTLGPVSVLPSEQKKGYGSAIINYTLDLAKSLGFGAVALMGSPDYYPRFGFHPASNYHIYYDDFPRNQSAPFFMIRELKDGYLKGVVGTYFDPAGYNVNQKDVDEFDKNFPPMKKEKREGQIGG